MYISKETIKESIIELRGTANHLLKIWLVLKSMGLDERSSVYIDTGNSTPYLQQLFSCGAPDGSFYIPFSHTSRFAFMKSDASRSIIQTTLQRWATSGSVVTCDPSSFLNISNAGDKLEIKTGRQYPLGLGNGKNGFALDDNQRVSIPAECFAIWLFSRKDIGNQTSEDLVSDMIDMLNLSPAEFNTIFVNRDIELKLQDEPIKDEELYEMCKHAFDEAPTIEEIVETDIVTTIRTANYDIAENIIIAEASKKIIALYPYSSESYDVLLPWVKLADKFKYSLKELYLISNKLNEKTLSGSHAFYYAPVMLAKIILGFDGVELKEEQDDTILFNMPGLYEEYIRTGFQRTGGKHGCTIQKGLTPRSFLFFNGECEMIPDIVIYDGNRIKALMDVKYKKPDSKDYYQIFAYMKYAKVDRAFIISPDVPDKQIITSFDGTKICYIRVDNSKHDYLENVADDIIRDIM